MKNVWVYIEISEDFMLKLLSGQIWDFVENVCSLDDFSTKWEQNRLEKNINKREKL